MGWAHVAAVVGVLLLGSVAVAGNANILLAKLGTATGAALLVSATPRPARPREVPPCRCTRGSRPAPPAAARAPGLRGSLGWALLRGRVRCTRYLPPPRVCGARGQE